MGQRIGIAMLAACFSTLCFAPLSQAATIISEPGPGAGQTNSPQALATDFETGDLYVADRGNNRIDVFDSSGDFKRAFGGDVIVDGASGTGNLTSGSASVTSVKTTSRVFEVGQTISGVGIPAETEILAVGFGTVTLSKPVTASGSEVTLSVAEGNNNVPSNERQRIGITGASGGTFALTYKTPNPSASEATATGISFNASAAALQGKLEALPNLGAGNVSVSGSAGGPWTVEFEGARYADTDVTQLLADGSGLTPSSKIGVTSSNAEEVCAEPGADCRTGARGSDPGQFTNPSSIAVDNDPSSAALHEVYVSDFDNRRVERFNPAGDFQLTFGDGVNQTTSGSICTAVSGDLCGPGADGTDPGELSGRAGVIPLGIGPGGTVYVGDGHLKGQFESEGFESRVQLFEASGTFGSEHALGLGAMKALAVNSGGSFYVETAGEGGGLRRYDAGGNLLEEIPQREALGLAVDPADDLFFSERELSEGRLHFDIAERDSAGSVLRHFGYGEIESRPSGLAFFHTGSGDLYATEGSSVIYLALPPLGPVIASPCSAISGNTKATLEADVNPEGTETTTHFQYVDQESFEEEGGFASPNTVATSEGPSIGSDFSAHKASAEVDVTPEMVYHCRAIAKNADGEAIGPEGSFQSKSAFEITQTFSSGVASESAQLNTSVKPLGTPATGFFEYVDQESFEESGFAEAKLAPAAEELDFGASKEEAIARSTPISGLLPGTRYRFRIVVKDSFFPAGKPGDTKTFRTPQLSAEIPDGRKYELVSPGDKNSGEVGVPTFAGGLYEGGVAEKTRIAAAARSGEAVTYTSFISFGEDAKSAPGASQYLSRRGASGWTTQNVNLRGSSDAFRPSYKGFTADLGFAGVVTDEPPITAEAVAGFSNLYLRENGSGALATITTEEPEVSGGETFCVEFAGATPDGQHAIFLANGALAGAPKAKGFSLYEWSAGKGVSLVSVLPGEVAAQPSFRSTFGAVGFLNCEADKKIARNAISADGSRIFWTYVPPVESDKQLMARLGGSETIELDEAQAGAEGPSGGGEYWAASNDGSRVIFTDERKLTEESGEGDLYRYDVQARALKDLTPDPEGAEVLGVLGASEDGSYVYFAANGVLAAGATPGNCSGQGSSGAGSCDLYLYHAGEGVRFIGTVAGLDNFDWSKRPIEQSARVSPDGRHLAFLSIESEALAGYDNTVASGTHCQPEGEEELGGSPRCPEAFLYDADAETLRCASCNPTSERPAGPTILPSWSNPYEQPHDLSDDGTRLFFETLDSLVPSDENERYDVYELELPQTGSCNEASTSFAVEAGGCFYLISSGQSDENSYLIDASSDGRDVFFSTRQRLLPGRDQDERYDVYDFRVGGGFPELSEPPSCETPEACHPLATPPPAAPSPKTSSFSGPGNVKPKKHHKKHKHKHHSHKKRRAAR